jgi:hypothetical protein
LSRTIQSIPGGHRVRVKADPVGVRSAAKAARRIFYDATQQIDIILRANDEFDKMAEKLRPYLEAASLVPEGLNVDSWGERGD